MKNIYFQHYTEKHKMANTTVNGLIKAEINLSASLQGDCEKPIGHRVKQPPGF